MRFIAAAAAAATVVAAVSTQQQQQEEELAPTKTPFFDVVREGPGMQKAISIMNPTDEEINVGRLKIGRVFREGEEFVITLNNSKIVDHLYEYSISLFSPGLVDLVVYPGSSITYAEVDERAGSFWGDYAIGYHYEALTNFNEDDVLKLYWDGQVVDVYGNENHLKTHDVCGITNATKGNMLVRKLSTTRGNTVPLGSFGNDINDCEWVVFDSSKDVLDAFSHGASSPFVSQYYEGRHFNKYIEFYNPSDETIRLSSIDFYPIVNGIIKPALSISGGLTKIGFEMVANGEVPTKSSEINQYIPAKSHNVVCNTKISDHLREKCDYFLDTITSFNGNDGFIVMVNGQVTDVFGGVSKDVQDVCGVKRATRNYGLVRKPSVCTGNTKEFGSFGTSAENCEWTVLGLDASIETNQKNEC